jgi:branched-chain amino acid transport system permease protein
MTTDNENGVGEQVGDVADRRTEGDVVVPAHRRGPRISASAQLPRRWAWAREHTLLWHVLGLIVGLALSYWVTESVGPFRNSQVANVGYYICAVGGLTVLVGLNGQISLGHGAFMMVGAYTVALLTIKQGWGTAETLVAAVVISALVGVVVGATAARLRGPYLAGATLAFAVGLPAITNWNKAEGFLSADTGLSFPTPNPPGSLANHINPLEWLAWISLISALLVLFFLANLTRSRVGRNFRAVRDDEVAAQLCGLNIARVQITAFIVSAACAGLGGGLLALVTGLAAPGAFTLVLSISLLTAVIIGGLGSLAGAVYGSLVLVFLPTWADNFGASHNLGSNIRANIPIAIYGAVLIIAMLVFPQGLQGALRRLLSLVTGIVRRRGPRTARHGG